MLDKKKKNIVMEKNRPEWIKHVFKQPEWTLDKCLERWCCGDGASPSLLLSLHLLCAGSGCFICLRLSDRAD